MQFRHGRGTALLPKGGGGHGILVDAARRPAVFRDALTQRLEPGDPVVFRAARAEIAPAVREHQKPAARALVEVLPALPRPDRGDGLTSEIWWTPSHPFNSSLTGESAQVLADGYSSATGRPWTQPIGFKHALFEVVADVIGRSADLEDPAATLEAIRTTSLATIVGDVDWAQGPVPNVTKTPLVAGQWQKQGDRFELVVTTNTFAPQIPVGGSLKLLS